MMRQGASWRERERDIRKEKECVVCECVCLGMKGACEQLEILYSKVLSRITDHCLFSNLAVVVSNDQQ